jgi:metal-responsive CopG/Arc/MetJ family transcriptional regulator
MKDRIIQVPMNDELLRALDLASRQRGLSRAALIRTASEEYLRRLDEEEADREYEEGYVRVPEVPDFGEAQLAVLPYVWSKEAW